MSKSLNMVQFNHMMRTKKEHYGITFSCLLLSTESNPFCKESLGMILFEYKLIVFNWDLLATLPSEVQEYIVNHEFAHYFAGYKSAHGPKFQEWLSILDYNNVEQHVNYTGKGLSDYTSKWLGIKEALYKAFIAPFVTEVVWQFQK